MTSSKIVNQPSSKRRAADLAYEAIETIISTLQLEPGSPVVEDDLAQRTQLGRTPVREALHRMVSTSMNARFHMKLAQGIATADEGAAVLAANQSMDYLERFARRVIEI